MGRTALRAYLVAGFVGAAVVGAGQLIPLSGDESGGATAAYAQGGGAGVSTGTAQFAIHVGNNGLAVPGGTAVVTVALTVAENIGSANIDILFDEELLSIGDPPTDCTLAARLTSHSLTASSAVAPLRLVINDFTPPVAELGVGDLATCNLRVSESAQIGTDIELMPDRVNAGSAGDGTERICGVSEAPVECVANGAVVMVQAATSTPTPTNTPLSTATVTPTGGATSTVTPTGEATATVTPTVEGTATVTPTEGTPTNTPVTTATNTRQATATNTPEATATPTEEEGSPTATRTNTPKGGGGPGIEDDSCAIVPASQVNPLRSLILLAVPALLLWGRRRRL